MGLKISAYGRYAYFYKPANKLDFFLLFVAFIDIMFSQIQSFNKLWYLKNITQILLVLRATRIFKLLKQIEGVKKLVITIYKIVPSMLNILGLLFLILFIFAILGTYLFKTVKTGNDLNNFNNFGYSFLLMFRMSTGEDWHIIMYDCMDYHVYSFVYFVIYVVLV